MRPALFVLLALVPTLATARTHYLDVYNTSSSSIASFAIAPAGSDGFRDVPLASRPVRGGGNSVTIAIDPDDGCLRDLRTTFVDGRVLVRKGFDVCRLRSYHTGRAVPAGKDESSYAALAD